MNIHKIHITFQGLHIGYIHNHDTSNKRLKQIKKKLKSFDGGGYKRVFKMVQFAFGDSVPSARRQGSFSV